MPVFYAVLFAITAVFSGVGPTAMFADDDDYEISPRPEIIGPELPEWEFPEAPSGHMTDDSIVAEIEAATKYCELLLPREYIVDCLSERLGALSKQLEGQKEFAEVQAILELTARKLNNIARENRSTTLPAANFSTPGKKPGTTRIATSRPLIPVDEAKMDKAIAEAIVVIEEAQTLLLRSAESSTERSVQFQRISAALGSNKVLLRSA